MAPKLIHYFLLTGTVLLTAACSKEDSPVSNTPRISFESITKTTREAGPNAGQAKRDSVTINISFTDGDGKLGENMRDTNRINQVFAVQSWGNYKIRSFKLVNGQFEEFLIAANSKLFFPSINDNPKPKGANEGILSFSQKFVYQGNFQLVPVKFQVQIRDRDLNESNTVETDTLRLPIVQ